MSSARLRVVVFVVLPLCVLAAGALGESGCGRRTPTPMFTSGVLDTTAIFDVSPSPLPVRAGVVETWTLHLRDRASGKLLTRFDVVHEKLLHLIIAAQDLSWFNHIHPTLAPDGTWTVQFALPRPGTYRLFADYTRAGGRHEVLASDITTSERQASAMPTAALVPDVLDAHGFVSRSVEATPESHPEVVGGEAYTVRFMPMPAYIIAGQPVMLHATVLDAQAHPVTDLEPYLGALGHAVVVSEDRTRYLHVHPMGDRSMAAMPGMSAMPGMTAADSSMMSDTHGPNVIFHTQFPRGGRYKLWMQFQHHGAIITVPFVLEVRDKT